MVRHVSLNHQEVNSKIRMFVSAAAIALLLTYWIVDRTIHRTSAAAVAAEVCNGSCHVEGQDYYCYGLGDDCMTFSGCDAADMPCTEDEVTARILCFSYTADDPRW